ncbi:MAG: galactose mutarotase [SAR324 cluster bacterium]|nr:galactose mutarotase [SAR324 cluster bacterium]
MNCYLEAVKDENDKLVWHNELGEYLQKCLFEIKPKLTFSFLNFGGAITELSFLHPKTNQKLDIILGYHNYRDYFNNNCYFGALIGRFANRIANSCFNFQGKSVKLTANSGAHHIHGGSHGLSFSFWNIEIIKSSSTDFIAELTYQDKQKPNSYLGDVDFTVRYHLLCHLDDDKYQLKVSFNALPHQPGILNLTLHPYFNLAGHDRKTLDNHSFQIFGDKIAENNQAHLPTGKTIDVTGTSMDLRQAKTYKHIKDNKQGLVDELDGFDFHYFIGEARINKKMAVVEESSVGLKMEISSTLPGIQFYNALNLDVANGKNNTHYSPRKSFCLEPQFAPASIFKNGIDYPSIVFSRDKPYNHTITYDFSFT